jgi:hypothetical protein
MILLGSAALALLLLVSANSPAGIAGSCDFDGIPDFGDNCVCVDNGPLAGVCGAQEDGDMDGYGNSCDTGSLRPRLCGLDFVSVMSARMQRPL